MKQVSINGPKSIEGDRTDDELFEHFRWEFLRISTQLETMAADKNLEGRGLRLPEPHGELSGLSQLPGRRAQGVFAQ